MALSCTKDFSLTVASPTVDMPLDAAVYHAGNDAIYAVRGAYLFRLNPTTGALVSSNRFTQVSFMGSAMCLDTTNDKIWVTMHIDPGLTAYSTTRNKRLYDLSPTDLSLTTSYNLTSYLDSNYNAPAMGPGSIIFYNGLLYTTSYDSGGRHTGTYQGSDITTNANLASLGGLDSYAAGLAINTDTGKCWATDTNGATGDIKSEDGDVWTVLAGRWPTDLCYSPSNGYFYCSTATQYVAKVKASDGSTPGDVDTSRANARPLRIKYNSYDGLIYCPLYHDDTVAVINPATDAVTIYTGFDMPYDVVFTPTKQFAVQHGNAGLLEITA